ncbi:DNA polymerase III subunit delta [Nocardioides mesophilus]|uniref:DNA-directed DNA polymerase n=1 Tax=Nocardioides mesophilus TaxID=433659 RepID=A0A7G9RCN5_9ACTN|nr:DNA polymerase III subunit delta [Nocardioides mesophilus]QNN53360.1 DNA polymerase III subunit delta [Nocardioides mesophilus]
MANPTATDVLGHVTLITGPEELLNQRAVTAATQAVRRAEPECEVSETNADQLSMAALADLAAPSLFSSIRCVVVRGLENLPEESHPGIVDYAEAPSDEVGLILVHGGGQKGTGLLNKLRKLPRTVTEIKSASLKPSEFVRFLVAEVRSHGGRIDDEAATLLVQAIGQDLRALAGAAHQLTSDFPDAPLTESVVKRYFGGRAEVKSFAVADAALYGRTAVALEELRWALDSGTAPVLVPSAFAGGLRGLARVMAAPRGMRDGDLAREAGVPPWKLRMLREQARGWDDDGLARAITAVAQADADVKGAASDAAYALERMVLRVTGARLQR